MEQHLLTPGPLLDGRGNLAEAGYAYSLVKRYDRNAIAAGKMRIKEWDYYYVGNEEAGLALTVADNGYMSMASVTVLEFGKFPRETTKSVIGLFSMGKLKMPSDSRMGDIVFENKKKGFSMSFLHQGDKRRLICSMSNFTKDHRDFRCDITLIETNGKSMVIATPWKKKAHFYYNQKINNQLAGGYCKVGEQMYDFNKGAYGVLDWGRGVWTYKNTWYWSSLSTEQDGVPIGFNLGYGFGNNDQASENMLFVGKEVYKLNDVKMDIPLNRVGGPNFMEPWTFRSSDGSIDMRFTPILDRKSDTNLLILRSNQHQVFGYFDGVIEADGKEFPINHKLGFAEKVYNRW